MGLFFNKDKKEKEYLESLDINSMMNERFCFIVDDVYTIIGIGTVVTGEVKSGMCHQDDIAILQTSIGNLETTILGIDVIKKKRKPNGMAYRGEKVGIHLRGIDKGQITIGDKLILK